MAQQQDQRQDDWNEGLSQWRQAVELNMTASRLLATGAIAVGAAATAYFWDSGRRNAFMDGARRWSDDMNNWWSGGLTGSKKSGDASNNAS